MPDVGRTDPVLSLSVVTLDLKCLKLRHQLEAAGYTLNISAERVPDTVAHDTGAICVDCSNHLTYQV